MVEAEPVIEAEPDAAELIMPVPDMEAEPEAAELIMLVPVTETEPDIEELIMLVLAMVVLAEVVFAAEQT